MPNDDEGRVGKVVLYVTSVQVVRETHEMCKQVVHILRSRRVAFIQKDVFLHPDYGRELSERLEVEEEEEEQEDRDGSITLPQVKQNPQRPRISSVPFPGSCAGEKACIQFWHVANISVYKKHRLYNRLYRNHIGSVVFQTVS